MKFKMTNEPKKELEIIMSCLLIVCGSCLFVGILRNLMLCYRLGKDDTPDFIWQMVPESITLIAMVACSAFVLAMLRNVKQRQIFTLPNANLILAIGVTLELNGLVQLTIRQFAPTYSDNPTYLIYLLLGCFFLFISCLFKLGIRMQEEQDLTV